MNRGIVKFTPNMLLHHSFPETWEIVSIRVQDDFVEAIINGPEFPWVPIGHKIPECAVYVTKSSSYEYKIIPKEETQDANTDN